jgi:hypothetical protein
MDDKDRKNMGNIKVIVRGMEFGVYSEDRIKELLEERGITVSNMSSVLQFITRQTPYLQQLSEGNYLRTGR